MRATVTKFAAFRVPFCPWRGLALCAAAAACLAAGQSRALAAAGSDKIELPPIVVMPPEIPDEAPPPPPKTPEERFRDAIEDRKQSPVIEPKRDGNKPVTVKVRSWFGFYCLHYDPLKRPDSIGDNPVVPTNCPK
jgi:hypothetical protein